MTGAEWKCPSCYKLAAPEPVQIRLERGEPWFDSSVQRCPLCSFTFGGTLEDRLAYIDCEYNYKYFGDYPLSEQQADAVGTAVGLAHQVPALLEALKALVAEANRLGPQLPYNAPTADIANAISAARAAIAKATGQ